MTNDQRMDNRALEKHRARLRSQLPLIGGWLRRRAADALAQDDSPAAARVLVEALTGDEDAQSRELAAAALRSLKQPSAIDAVCAVWQHTRHEALAALIRQQGWVARDPPRRRVLTALQAQQLEPITQGGPELVQPLLQACTDRDSCIAFTAKALLCKLQNQLAIDALCQRWVAERDPLLAEAITEARYVADHPPDCRVLTALRAQHLERITQGGPELVQPLLQACSDADPGIAVRARRALCQLQQSETREALCRLVVEEGHLLAREAALQAGYVPREPAERALFYFLTEQWEQYESLDFDHRLLRAAFESAAEALRQRLMAQARAAGRVEWVEVVSGGRQARRLAQMTETEWKTALDVLTGQRQWQVLWRLAQRAPPCWSARLLARLAEVGWQPPHAERPGFADLLALAQHWRDPDLNAGARALQTLHGHTGIVECLAVSPDGRLLASGSNDKTVRLWGLPDGRPLATLQGHTWGVFCLAVSRDGRVLASGGREHIVRLWGLPEGRALQSLQGHTDKIHCLAVSPDGWLLASGGADKTVWLWGSDLVRLARLPAEQAMPGDLEWAQATLQAGHLSGSNRHAMEFIAALLRSKARFDVVVEEAPQRIAAGEFDIEIEG